MKSSPEQLTHIDLFAGCGGFSLGLQYAGWDGIFAIEKDGMAFETLMKNSALEESPYPHFAKLWPDWLPKTPHDIKELMANRTFKRHLKALEGKVTLVCGGPPCQGFSVGGVRRPDDVRNELPFEFLKFVKLVKPKAVMMENVLGIAKSFGSTDRFGGQSVVSLVVQELESLGYSAGYTKVKSLDFGVPQDRRRIITIGIKKALARDIDPTAFLVAKLSRVAAEQLAQLKLPKNRHITIDESLHDLAGDEFVPCPDSPKFQSSKYLPAKSRYASLMRRGKRTGTIPNSHRFSQHGEKVLNLYKKIHATQPRGRVPMEFLRNNDTKTMKKFLLGPDGYSSTLTTHPDETIHYVYPRNISIREMARIQSFPDDWHFYGRYTLNGERRKLDVSRCAQIGNAVPPFMAQALGSAVAGMLSDLSRPDWKEVVMDNINGEIINDTLRLFP